MTDSQKWLIFVFIAVGAWLIYLLAPVLMPFAFAAMLAYLGDPLADKLETYHLSRTSSVIAVFSVMTLILGLILLLLVRNWNIRSHASSVICRLTRPG